MAQEAKRGCGYRKVGGMYLVGGYLAVPCDRLPMEVGACPVCGSGVHFSRGLAKIDAQYLFGTHAPQKKTKKKVDVTCTCEPSCYVCYPREGISFLMGVGEKYYTPDEFIREAQLLGISKRIPQIPKEMKLGETVVYLVHKKAIQVPKEVTEPLPSGQAKMLPDMEFRMGVIAAFIPRRIEKLLWKNQAETPEGKEEIKKLEKRGITPVLLDFDPDHVA